MEEAKTIAKVFWNGEGKTIIIEKPEKENNLDNFLYDISKAKEVLDWSPKYSFEDMLYDFIKETNDNNFGYLHEKRRIMFNESNDTK